LLKNMTKAEATYQEVRWRILTGVLSPNATINQEELARELGVSATPLREALRRLDGEDLVDFVAHSTIRVSGISLRELDELYGIRYVLDPLAARLAAEVGTSQEINDILKLATWSSSESQSRTRFEANRAFHRAIYESSGNLELAALLDRLWNRTDRYRFILVTTGADAPASAIEHMHIAETIARRDGELAAQLLAAHIKRSHDIIATLLQEEARLV
jgi:DNA-binding GntR family transcriptional regulator